MSTLKKTSDSTLPGISISPFTTVFPESYLQNFVHNTIGDDLKHVLWFHADSSSGVPPLHNQFTSLGNLQPINDVLHLNKLLKKANLMLDRDGYYILLMETKKSRKSRIYGNRSKVKRRPIYLFDFLWKRVLPKTFLNSIYFKITKGKNQVISLSEALARLIFCGFEIINHEQTGRYTAIIVRKNRQPENKAEPTTGMFISLPRIGFNGEVIRVYKFRTMHPYSEFLQEYLYENHGTNDGDKIKNDFRVTRWGRLFRKYWIDEIPMLINYFKGQLKLVGPRPLSEHKFLTYPESLQKARIRVKPGLIPPYYADMPETPEEFFESEQAYLEAYHKNRWKTDFRYLGKSVYNILFRGARSK
ncbi:MAG: sugar transferase [Balneolaceae bacterium]|nr:sugar transferase [Balneolaceae bacterium]